MEYKRIFKKISLFAFIVICTSSCSNKKEIFKYEKIGETYKIVSLNSNLDEQEYQNIVIPDFYNNLPVTEIGYGAFSKTFEVMHYSPLIKNIKIGNNIKKIDDFAFNYCTNIKEIDLPSNIETIGNYVFNWCKNLETINIYCDDCFIKLSNDNRLVFNVCESLQNINLPSGMELLPSFNTTLKLKNLKIPETIKYIEGNTFYDCISLEEIVLPDSVESIDYLFLNTGIYSNYGVKLSKIRFPKNITSFKHESNDISFETYFESLDENTSFGTIGIAYSNLKEIEISDENKLYSSLSKNCILNKETHKLLFGCSTTEIDKSVTTIGKNAFRFDKNLKDIYIPENVTSIEEYAFPNEYDYTINCEASEKPKGWDENWSSKKILNVNWGVKR